MRFLFVNQYYAPDYAATAQQLSDLCRALIARGHEVHVLTSAAIYDGRKLDLPDYEVLDGVHVHRVGMKSSGRERFRDRLLGYAQFYLKAFWKSHFIPRPDVVVPLTTPPLIALLAGWMRLLRGCKVVFWVMDVYPDIAFRAGVISRFGPVRFMWSALGRLTYLAANQIVVLGGDMKRVIDRKCGKPAKVHVIRSWASAEEVFPVSQANNKFRAEHVDADAFSLMYSGNAGTCHTFGAVVDGIAKLAGSKGFQFLFVGGGKRMGQLKHDLGAIANVKFLPYQDRSVLSESLSAPDAQLITLDPTYDGLLVPSKVYGIMAAGRPILFCGSEDNEIARIVREAKCGKVVPPHDGAAFGAAVEWMAANRDEVRAMGERGRAYFQEHFDCRIGTDAFADLLETACQPANAQRPIPAPAAKTTH